MSRFRRKSFSALLTVAAAAGLVAGAAAAPAATAAPASAEASVGKVVGYFTEWGVYDRNYHVKNIETSGSASKLTHINYAFGNVTNGGCAIGDAYADYQKTYDAAGSVDGVADTWDQPLAGSFNQLQEAQGQAPRPQGDLVVRRLDLVGRLRAGRAEPRRVRRLLLQPGQRPALGRRLRRHRHRLGVPQRLRPEL